MRRAATKRSTQTDVFRRKQPQNSKQKENKASLGNDTDVAPIGEALCEHTTFGSVSWPLVLHFYAR